MKLLRFLFLYAALLTASPLFAATFDSDTFTGTNGTDLTAHTSDSGGTWTKFGGRTGAVLIQSNAASDATGAVDAGYILSGTPASADYDVQEDITFSNAGNGNLGVYGRASSSANTCYWAVWTGGNTKWNIYKFVAGTSTLLSSSAAFSATNGTVYTLKLSMRGTTLSLYVNGTLQTSTTDSSITAAGFAGVSFYNNAAGETGRADNFVASDPVANTIVYADNAALRVSPYNHRLAGSGSSAVDTVPNTGAYWRVYETGSTTAVLTFAAAPTGTYLSYRWDGGPWTRVAVATNTTLSNVPTATTVQHLLEWCFTACSITTDRWTNNPPTNSLQFTGLTLDGGSTVSAPAARPKNVLIYGDSIKEGTRTVAATNSTYPSTDNDVTLSAYFALQDALNAEIGLVAFSGQGLVSTTNSASENVPNLAGSYNYLWSGVARTFSPQPDLCIIDEGQNDGGQSATTAQTNLVTVAQGAGAKVTMIVGDESGYQTAAAKAAVVQLGATAFYVAPANVAAGASVGNTGVTVDSFDGVHPTGAAHRSKLLPALASTTYPILYNAATATVVPRAFNLNTSF